MEYQKIKKVFKDDNDKEVLKKMPKERYISPEGTLKTIDNLIPIIIA